MRLPGKSKSSVGLEFSGERLRAVMVEAAGDQLRVVGCGSMEFGPQQVNDGEVLEVERVAEEIGTLFRELRLNPRHVATSISGRAVIVKRIQMDSMSEDMARDALQFEASEHLPFDIKDVCLDFQILREGLPNNQMEVLLVAARREVIASRRSLLAEAGLSLNAIDVDAFAIQRAYEWNYAPDQENTVVLVHVGDQVTSINVVRGGLPLFVRDLPLATHSFLKEVEQRQGLAPEEARRIVLGKQQECAPAVAEALQVSANALSLEIERSFAYMRASDEVGPLHQIVLSGEGARVPGLAQHLSDFLRLPVELADPLRRLAVDPAAFAGREPATLAPSLMIAVGLALKERN